MSAECIVEPLKNHARTPACMQNTHAHRIAPIGECQYLKDLGIVAHTGQDAYFGAARAMYKKLKSYPDMDTAFTALGITTSLEPCSNPVHAINMYYVDLTDSSPTMVIPSMNVPRMYSLITRDKGQHGFTYIAAFHFFNALYPNTAIRIREELPDNVLVRDGVETGVMMYVLEQMYGVTIFFGKK